MNNLKLITGEEVYFSSKSYSKTCAVIKLVKILNDLLDLNGDEDEYLKYRQDIIDEVKEVMQKEFGCEFVKWKEVYGNGEGK